MQAKQAQLKRPMRATLFSLFAMTSLLLGASVLFDGDAQASESARSLDLSSQNTGLRPGAESSGRSVTSNTTVAKGTLSSDNL